MKRHPALQDLSRDHHLVLQRMQWIRRALARQASVDDVASLVDDLVRFYGSDMAPHFQEEDELVVPSARDHGDASLQAAAAKVLAEHREFRTRFNELAAMRGDPQRARALLARLEPLVTAHVHDEEAGLFEGVQQALSEPELDALWRRSYQFRQSHRAPDSCGPAPRPPPARRQERGAGTE